MNGLPRASVPLSIGYITWVFPVLSQTFVDQQILALKRSGWDVVVMAARPGREPVRSSTATLLAPDTVTLPSYRDSRLWRAIVRTVARKPGRVARCAWMLRAWLDQPGIVARVLYLLPRMLYFAAWCEHRRVQHLHVDFLGPHTIVAQMIATLLDVSYSARLHTTIDGGEPSVLRRLLRDASFAVANGTATRDSAADRLGPDAALPMTIIPQAVDSSAFLAVQSRPSASDRVLAVGRLHPQKGFNHLVEAARILAASGRRVQIDIVGEGHEREHLEAQIEAHGLDDVRLRGARPHEAIPGLVADAAIVAMPSVSDSPDGERDGLPTVIIEAMAAGRPVVSTPVGSIRDVVVDGVTGYIVPEGDPAALAEALHRLLASPESRDRMGEAGRARVLEQFDIGRNTARLMERIRGAVDAHNAARQTAGLRTQPGQVSAASQRTVMRVTVHEQHAQHLNGIDRSDASMIPSRRAAQ